MHERTKRTGVTGHHGSQVVVPCSVRCGNLAISASSDNDHARQDDHLSGHPSSPPPLSTNSDGCLASRKCRTLAHPTQDLCVQTPIKYLGCKHIMITLLVVGDTSFCNGLVIWDEAREASLSPNQGLTDLVVYCLGWRISPRQCRGN